MKPCDLWILCLSASVFELKESVWYFSYFAIVIFVFSWPWGDTWQVLPQRRRQSPQPYQNSWGHAAPGWSLFILWLRSCLIWWWCLQHGTARPMWFQSTCCCTSSLPHRWRICLSASCWKLHYSGCSPAAAWSPPGPGPRGAPGSAAGCCVWPWWCGSSWTTAMIPWKNSIQNKFATRLQATAVKGCRPGCKHPVTRRGGEAAAPPAWRVTTSTAAASRRCRGSVEATATARVETAPWRLYRSGYWSCQVQWRMLPHVWVLLSPHSWIWAHSAPSSWKRCRKRCRAATTRCRNVPRRRKSRSVLKWMQHGSREHLIQERPLCHSTSMLC